MNNGNLAGRGLQPRPQRFRNYRQACEHVGRWSAEVTEKADRKGFILIMV